MPGGRVTSTPFSSWLPSLRVTSMPRLVKLPAWVLLGFAAKPGAKGRSPSVFAQAPPPGAEVRVNSPDGVAAGLPDQGVIVETILWGPQIAGLVSVARGPPSSFSTKELNGTWGSSWKRVVSCPVTGLALTRPTSLTERP